MNRVHRHRFRTCAGAGRGGGPLTHGSRCRTDTSTETPAATPEAFAARTDLTIAMVETDEVPVAATVWASTACVLSKVSKLPSCAPLWSFTAKTTFPKAPRSFSLIIFANIQVWQRIIKRIVPSTCARSSARITLRPPRMRRRAAHAQSAPDRRARTRCAEARFFPGLKPSGGVSRVVLYFTSRLQRLQGVQSMLFRLSEWSRIEVRNARCVPRFSNHVSLIRCQDCTTHSVDRNIHAGKDLHCSQQSYLVAFVTRLCYSVAQLVLVSARCWALLWLSWALLNLSWALLRQSWALLRLSWDLLKQS